MFSDLHTFRHIVITRFCIRFRERAKSFNGTSRSMQRDPLERSNVEFRKVLLECFSLPSLASQTSKHFTWVILTEPDLPDDIRRSLDELLRPYPNFHIHTLSDEDFLGHRDWLDAYLDKQPDVLVTTHLDDDDALPADFIEEMDKRVKDAFFDEEELPVHIFGTRNVIQWDMDFNEDFPYGTYSEEWHRTRFAAVSCGFTIAAKYPECRLYVLSFLHSRLDSYFDKSNKKFARHPSVRWVRGRLSELYKEIGLDPEGIFDIELHDLTKIYTQVLMSNHGRNVQVNRIHEPKSDYHPVEHEQRFGRCIVDWKAVDRYRQYFENVPDWQRVYKTPFPKKQIMIVKWAIQDFLFGKAADPNHPDRPRRPRTRREHEEQKKEG